MSSPTVYLNGEFLPIEQAHVSVLDRGFLFGDGIYEVIPAYSGKPFRAGQHLARLQNSLDAVYIDNPHDTAQWLDILNELIARNGGGTLSIYLQITRGVAQKRDHAIDPGLVPTVFLMATPIMSVDIESLVGGVAAVRQHDIRWDYCHIKAITLLPNVLLKHQARLQSAIEAILIRDGLAVEGAASNLFAVIDGKLVTPPTGPTLLPGITRDLVLELATAHGVEAIERNIEQEELDQASEIWLTSSTREILPVVTLDDKPVGEGKAGPVWHRMIALYQEYKAGLACKSHG